MCGFRKSDALVIVNAYDPSNPTTIPGAQYAYPAIDLLNRMVVVGMPTEGAVRDVVLAACEAGLEVLVVHEGIRAMNVQPNDGREARAAMREAGAYITRLMDSI